MNKPSSKATATTVKKVSQPKVSTDNKEPILGPSKNNPPIGPDDFMVEVVDNRKSIKPATVILRINLTHNEPGNYQGSLVDEGNFALFSIGTTLEELKQNLVGCLEDYLENEGKLNDKYNYLKIEDIVLEYITEQLEQKTIEQVQEEEIETFNNLNPDDEVSEEQETTTTKQFIPFASHSNNFVDTSNLNETYLIVSESRAVMQNGRGGAKFQIGNDFSTRILKSGYTSYKEAAEYLNSNINSEEFKYEGDFKIVKVYNRK
jgi:hypothetical protein